MWDVGGGRRAEQGWHRHARSGLLLPPSVGGCGRPAEQKVMAWPGALRGDKLVPSHGLALLLQGSFLPGRTMRPHLGSVSDACHRHKRGEAPADACACPPWLVCGFPGDRPSSAAGGTWGKPGSRCSRSQRPLQRRTAAGCRSPPSRVRGVSVGWREARVQAPRQPLPSDLGPGLPGVLLLHVVVNLWEEQLCHLLAVWPPCALGPSLEDGTVMVPVSLRIFARFHDEV